MADDAELNAELRRRLRAADRVINQMTADAERTQAQLNMAWDLCSKQADEIERLRAAGDALALSIETFVPGVLVHISIKQAFIDWQEARRG